MNLNIPYMETDNKLLTMRIGSQRGILSAISYITRTDC